MTKITIYNSSAGSGKTYTLTKEYLKLCLKQKNNFGFKNILAVTFTNKAAKEMKERIIENLKDFSQDKNPFKLNEIAQELNQDVKKLQQKSKQVLSYILHNYSDFSISTIDKFFHKIIRSFASDLNLDTRFSTETNIDNYITKAVELTVEQIGVDEDISQIINNIAFDRLYENGKKWGFKDTLIKNTKVLGNESSIVPIKNLKETSLQEAKNTQQKIANRLKDIKQQAKVLLNLLNKNGIKKISFSRQSLPNYLTKIINGNFDTPTNTLIKCANEKANWYTQKTDIDQKVKIDAIHKQLSSFVLYMEKGNSTYTAYQNALTNFYSNYILGRIANSLKKLKKEENVVFISDFNKLINEQVKQLPVPFIYERVGEKYDHYFIDEFQDTSKMQWENFEPLVENTLSQGGNTILVGDGKQSIYRWRGGNIEQFSKLNKKNNSKSLGKNFRSGKNIIEFNNLFFETCLNILNEEHKPIYNNCKQQIGNYKQNGIGYIKLEFVKADKKEENIENQLPKILETIKKCIDNNYQQKDIGIIVRNNEQARIIAEYLIEKKYNIISSEALLISNNTQVKFLLNIFECINNPTDKFSLLEVVEFLGGNVYECSQKNIFEIVLNKEKNYNPNKVEQLSLYELTEYFIKLFDLKIDLYLQSFLNEILDYSSQKSDNISEFIEFWNLYKKPKSAVIIPDDANGIKILTIHKSKGLEFPVVIVPFMDWVIDLKLENSWEVLEKMPFYIGASKSTKQEKLRNSVLLDNLNLIYVCFTRAVEQLYVFSSTKGQKLKDPISQANQLIKYFFNAQNIGDENNIYEFGTFHHKKIADKKDNITKNYTITNVVQNHWRDTQQIKIALQHKTKWDEHFWQMNWGHTAHKILSEIETKNDAHLKIKKYYNEGIISKEEKKIISENINLLLQNEILKPLFSKNVKVLNEMEFITKNGETLRPDRVSICLNNHVKIIDYKTGKQDNSHITQVQKYIDNIKNMNYNSVTGYLVYLQNNYIQKI